MGLSNVKVALVCVAIAATRRGGPDGGGVGLGVAGPAVTAGVGGGGVVAVGVVVGAGVDAAGVPEGGPADGAETTTALAVAAGTDGEAGGIAASHALRSKAKIQIAARIAFTIGRPQALGRSMPRSLAKSIAS
jgi:hypothetical protein